MESQEIKIKTAKALISKGQTLINKGNKILEQALQSFEGGNTTTARPKGSKKRKQEIINKVTERYYLNRKNPASGVAG